MFSVFDLHTMRSFMVLYCRNMKLTSVIKAARFEVWFPSDWPSNTRVPEDVSFLVYVSVDRPVRWPGHPLPCHLVFTIAVSPIGTQYVQEWAVRDEIESRMFGTEYQETREDWSTMRMDRQLAEGKRELADKRALRYHPCACFAENSLPCVF